MYIEYQSSNASVWIRDLCKRIRTPVRHECLRACPVVTWKQDELRLGTSITDGGDGSLDGLSPKVDIGDIMGLVHDTKENLWLIGVFCGELRPERSELIIRGATLIDNFAVIASIVMDIDNTRGSSRETGLSAESVSCRVCDWDLLT
jgi:hypothetical protein